MFFETYKKLCEEHNEKPYSLPIKLGAKSNSIVAQWKSGSLPRPEMLQNLADYFGVSVGYLIDGDGAKEKPTAISGGGGIGPNKRELLNMVETMSEDEMAALLEVIKAVKKMGK